jgi:ABC-type branched-subunit amino acid transport system ATPase component
LTGWGVIEVHDIHKHFGGFHAVDGASLRIETGSITGLSARTAREKPRFST